MLIDHKTFSCTPLFGNLHKLDNSPTVYYGDLTDGGIDVLRHSARPVPGKPYYKLDYNFMPLVSFSKTGIGFVSNIYQVELNYSEDLLPVVQSYPCLLLNIVLKESARVNLNLGETQLSLSCSGNTVTLSDGDSVDLGQPFFSLKLTTSLSGETTASFFSPEGEKNYQVTSLTIQGQVERFQLLSGDVDLTSDLSYCMIPCLRFQYESTRSALEAATLEKPSVSRIYNSVLSSLSVTREKQHALILDRNTVIDQTIVVNSNPDVVKWRLYLVNPENGYETYREYSIEEAINLWNTPNWLRLVDLPFQSAMIYTRGVDKDGNFVSDYQDVKVSVCYFTTVCDISAYQATLIATAVESGDLDSKYFNEGSSYPLLGFRLSDQLNSGKSFPLVSFGDSAFIKPNLQNSVSLCL